ncbi:MAG: DUF2520 domain-containing protein, partial [Chlorobi bacterium]|nr:DUF2520 domain-containing protein [Chlorobiota bacterium]
TGKSAKKLAEKLNITFSVDISDIPASADLYVISVNDDSVFGLTENKILKEKIKNNLVVHTAGSIEMRVLKKISSNYGVFYPLQTFSKNKILDFKDIPVCIEANSGFNRDKLEKYASGINGDVRFINSEQRKYIHLAAVFANNFSNRMFGIAEEILKEKEIKFDILLPLIKETFEKIKHNPPSKVQTGPAVRNDEKVMEMHLELLKNKPELQKIYSFVSRNIKISKQ